MNIAVPHAPRHALAKTETLMGSDVHAKVRIPTSARMKPRIAIVTERLWHFESSRTGGSRAVPGAGSRKQLNGRTWWMKMRPCMSDMVSDHVCHTEKRFRMCGACANGDAAKDRCSEPCDSEDVVGSDLRCEKSGRGEMSGFIGDVGVLRVRVCGMWSFASMSLYRMSTKEPTKEVTAACAV